MTLADDLLLLPFSEDVIDRASELRRDRARLRDLWRSSSSRAMFVRAENQVAVCGSAALLWEKTALLDDDLEAGSIFLGFDELGGPLFGLVDSGDVAEREYQGLRDVALGLGRVDQAAAVIAVALATWHAHSGFCPGCGAPTDSVEGGHLRRCQGCGRDAFPRSDAAVIMMVSDGDRCVLGRRIGSPANRWSTLAGFVDAGESPEAAVRREVFEEVGLSVDRVRYRGSQPWPFPASLMLAFEAHAPYRELTLNEEHLEVRWFARAELAELLESGEIAQPSKLSAGGHLIESWLEAKP